MYLLFSPSPACGRGKGEGAQSNQAYFRSLPSGSLLSGCMVGPDYRRPAGNNAGCISRFSLSRRLPMLQSIADLKWFEVFKDEQLQELIRTALVQNYDLRDAVARVDAARANLGITQADQYPNFGIGADVTANEQSRQGQFTIPRGTAANARSARYFSIFLPLRSTSGAGCAAPLSQRAPNCWLRIGTEKP